MSPKGVVLLIASIGATTPTAASALDLVRDGKPVAVIVQPERAGAVEQEAARILVEHLRLASGATLAVVSEAAAPAGRPAIHVGWTKAARQAGLDAKALVTDGYFMRVQGTTLFLAGRDVGEEPPQSYQGVKGTLVAALNFLRDFAGVRWLMPGPRGTWTPAQRTIQVPDTLDRTYVPPLLYATSRLDRYYPYSPANGARMAINLFTAGGHTWAHGIPGATYGAAHPEYFAEIGGVRQSQPEQYLRRGAENPMLCTSHPQFVPLMTAWVQRKFEEGFDLVQLGESDGLKSCECARCTAQFGDAKSLEGVGRRVFLPHKEIAEHCLKSHPDKKILMLVYAGPRNWLLGEKDPGLRFPSNVVAESTYLAPDALAKLKQIVPHITAYNYWWSGYHGGLAPKQSPASISLQARKLREFGTLGVYFSSMARNSAAEGITYYVCLRTLQDPALKPDDLVREYCAGLYGKAARSMAAYYAALYRKVDGNPGSGTPAFNLIVRGAPTERRMSTKYVTYWPEESLKEMGTRLQQAEREAAGDPRALNWIRLARLGYEQVFYTAAVYHAHRAYEAKPSADTLRQIQARLIARQEFNARVKKLAAEDPAFVREYFLDYQPFSELLDDEKCVLGPMGPPFTWEIEKLLAEGKLP